MSHSYHKGQNKQSKLIFTKRYQFDTLRNVSVATDFINKLS